MVNALKKCSLIVMVITRLLAGTSLVRNGLRLRAVRGLVEAVTAETPAIVNVGSSTWGLVDYEFPEIDESVKRFRKSGISPASVERLLVLTRGPNDFVRWRALYALRKAKPLPTACVPRALTRFQQMLADPSDVVRAEASLAVKLSHH